MARGSRDPIPTLRKRRTGFFHNISKFIGLAAAAMLPTLAVARANATPIKGVAVLIPGTFNLDFGALLKKTGLDAEGLGGNGASSPVFSEEVIQSLASQGLAVEVVRSISPLAALSWNGEAALRELGDWYRGKYPAGNVPITLIGHGSGGFFALYAASHARDLPIHEVITIATPMNGLQLADKVFNSGWIGRELKRVCDQSDGWINLRGISALTSSEVGRFLGRLRLAPGTTVLHVAGSQPMPNAFHLTDSAFLSPLLALTARFIQGPSDGIVSVQSAYGGKTPLLDTRGQPVEEVDREDLFMPLDHAKQVLDYRLFAAMDESDLDLIEFLQQQAYTAIGSAIVSPAHPSPPSLLPSPAFASARLTR